MCPGLHRVQPHLHTGDFLTSVLESQRSCEPSGLASGGFGVGMDTPESPGVSDR